MTGFTNGVKVAFLMKRVTGLNMESLEINKEVARSDFVFYAWTKADIIQLEMI